MSERIAITEAVLTSIGHLIQDDGDGCNGPDWSDAEEVVSELDRLGYEIRRKS